MPRARELRWEGSRTGAGWERHGAFVGDREVAYVLHAADEDRWHRCCWFEHGSDRQLGTHKSLELAKRRTQNLYEQFVLESLEEGTP